ncbi:CRISPR-associated endonuclease Cas1 [Afifella sp. JA880]|uniref:CRISPR-associated endonuclease Cas1 n=1 Tax=Afifella sp. JA880 TaxID=2975280 RepID=UPI0021BA6A12|nr:CRISPR-associated endonuclease Cas1 [Afifella sp. JA880]MCT8268013.1 CRISPR-associated endonuclease Cas1 [Afifella sp. JA880]
MSVRLARRQKGGHRDFSVFEESSSLAMLHRAFHRVAANRGAAGGDRVTIGAFERGLDFRLKSLAHRLRTGAYEPGPVATVDIAKRSGGVRTLRIPCVADRVAQTAAHLVLQPLLEPEFEEHSYGYRPGRSVPQALEAVRAFHAAGFTHVVDADISAYFDNVPHVPLVSVLADYVPEPAFVSLVLKWLGLSAEPGRGLPQGAPISPILANLYLDHVDEEVAKAGFRMVRYADDFVVLCRSRQRAEKALQFVARRLEELHLSLHPEKTRIRSLDEGYVFLGARLTGTGLAAQVEALADLPDEPENDGSPASGALRGQLATAPARRVAGRELKPRKVGSSRLPSPASSETVAEDLAVYLAEGDEPACPGAAHEAADPSRYAPFVRPAYLLQKGRELKPYDAGFGVYDEGDLLAVIAPRTIDRIDVFPGAAIDSDAIRRAAELRICVFFVDGRGRVVSSLADERPWRSRLHLAQARHAFDESLALDLARRYVAGRIFNARRLIQQLRQRLDEKERAERSDLERVIGRLDQHRRRAEAFPGYTNVDAVRGEEGAAARLYWPALSSLVKRGFGEERFLRSRLPPETAFNTVLNFTAHLLRRDVETLIMRRGIHAGFGVLHRPDRARHGCVFDLMEEFRAPIAEALSVQLLSSGELGPKHFSEMMLDGKKAVHIVEEGPGKLIRAYERHVDHVINHPEGGKTTWRGVIDHQVTRYVRHVLGEEPYEPFRKDL